MHKEHLDNVEREKSKITGKYQTLALEAEDLDRKGSES